MKNNKIDKTYRYHEYFLLRPSLWITTRSIKLELNLTCAISISLSLMVFFDPNNWKLSWTKSDAGVMLVHYINFGPLAFDFVNHRR